MTDTPHTAVGRALAPQPHTAPDPLHCPICKFAAPADSQAVRLREALERLVEPPPMDLVRDWMYCHWCGSENRHKDDCAWIQARAILAALKEQT